MHLLIAGGTRADRIRRADAASATRRLDDIEGAFPNQQSAGTRFVLTQSTYVMQAYIDALGPDDRIVATADRAALVRNAPEAFEQRGPWRLFEVQEISSTGDAEDATAVAAGTRPAFSVSTIPTAASVLETLARAFATPDAAARLALCRDAVSSDADSALAWLALASANREHDDTAAAREALDRALALAPGWAAAHYEDGKFWLGDDDTLRARDSFQRTRDLMPTFSAASSNLGAALGELDDQEGALAAFRHALIYDPHGFQILSNIGVVTRELGRLDESAATFRQVIGLAPDFVFGYYNLGHTLFLAGRYEEALAAYEDGQRRDPAKNRRQGCRLAMARLAAGDPAGAERDLWRFADAAPADEREDLLLEAYEIVQTLADANPGLPAARSLMERIGNALRV